MQIYLPMAEISISLITLLMIGGGVGFVSGLFGVGGGFLLTPLLIFIGIPAATTVSTVTSTVTASSVSSALNHWRRKTIDFELARILILGGLFGSFVGVEIFLVLKRLGFLNFTVIIGYVFFLGSTGILMLIDSTKDLLKIERRRTNRLTEKSKNILSLLPFKRHFAISKVEISVLILVIIGFFIGIIGAVLGLGGGFILIPILIYFLRIAGPIVLGTAQIYIFATMLSATILHAWAETSLDIVLAFVLMLGGILGANIGMRVQRKLTFTHFRFALALLLIMVAINFASSIVLKPKELFTLSLENIK